MKQTKFIMGMPITVDIETSDLDIFKKVFAFFRQVDKKYSPFKKTSEVSQINAGVKKISPEMQEILALCEQTKQETDGYFDVYHNGIFNPSGLVKGWAINEAAKLIQKSGYKNYFVDAGGDIEARGKVWKVGIRNPFDVAQIVKSLIIKDKGVATSGNYERGKHIYIPKTGQPADEIASITVIGPNIYEADRFVTAAFAMGLAGINFIENRSDLEGYMINKEGIATLTSGFKNYEAN